MLRVFVLFSTLIATQYIFGQSHSGVCRERSLAAIMRADETEVFPDLPKKNYTLNTDGPFYYEKYYFNNELGYLERTVELYGERQRIERPGKKTTKSFSPGSAYSLSCFSYGSKDQKYFREEKVFYCDSTIANIKPENLTCPVEGAKSICSSLSHIETRLYGSEIESLQGSDSFEKRITDWLNTEYHVDTNYFAQNGKFLRVNREWCHLNAGTKTCRLNTVFTQEFRRDQSNRLIEVTTKWGAPDEELTVYSVDEYKYEGCHFDSSQFGDLSCVVHIEWRNEKREFMMNYTEYGLDSNNFVRLKMYKAHQIPGGAGADLTNEIYRYNLIDASCRRKLDL